MYVDFKYEENQTIAELANESVFPNLMNQFVIVLDLRKVPGLLDDMRIDHHMLIAREDLEFVQRVDSLTPENIWPEPTKSLNDVQCEIYRFKTLPITEPPSMYINGIRVGNWAENPHVYLYNFINAPKDWHGRDRKIQSEASAAKNALLSMLKSGDDRIKTWLQDRALVFLQGYRGEKDVKNPFSNEFMSIQDTARAEFLPYVMDMLFQSEENVLKKKDEEGLDGERIPFPMSDTFNHDTQFYIQLSTQYRGVWLLDKYDFVTLYFENSVDWRSDWMTSLGRLDMHQADNEDVDRATRHLLEYANSITATMKEFLGKSNAKLMFLSSPLKPVFVKDLKRNGLPYMTVSSSLILDTSINFEQLHTRIPIVIHRCIIKILGGYDTFQGNVLDTMQIIKEQQEEVIALCKDRVDDQTIKQTIEKFVQKVLETYQFLIKKSIKPSTPFVLRTKRKTELEQKRKNEDESKDEQHQKKSRTKQKDGAGNPGKRSSGDASMPGATLMNGRKGAIGGFNWDELPPRQKKEKKEDEDETKDARGLRQSRFRTNLYINAEDFDQYMLDAYFRNTVHAKHDSLSNLVRTLKTEVFGAIADNDKFSQYFYYSPLGNALAFSQASSSSIWYNIGLENWTPETMFKLTMHEISHFRQAGHDSEFANIAISNTLQWAPFYEKFIQKAKEQNQNPSKSLMIDLTE